MAAQTTMIKPGNSGAMPIRPPSLDNLSSRQWAQHAQIAFLFARHTRHDLANIHCALGLFEMVEHLGAQEDSMPLPPELQPDQIKEKVGLDVKQLISISNDLVMLSQAANLPAYQPINTVSLGTLFEDNVLSRLDPESSLPPQKVADALGAQRVIALGNTLGAAISAFYFQWTPWMHPHGRVAGISVKSSHNRVTLGFPADDTEAVASFARRLQADPASAMSSISEQVLSTTTTELALWMARMIVLIHGGWVDADPDDPGVTIRVTLPLVP